MNVFSRSYRGKAGGALPGQAQGIHVVFTLDGVTARRLVEHAAERVEGWFVDREEITLVDVGLTDKQERGYLIAEWEECEVDPTFLSILQEHEAVFDFTLYTRDLLLEEGDDDGND